MDKDTRDFILEQTSGLHTGIHDLRESIDKKLTTMNETLSKQNLKLGAGSEKFKSIDAAIETERINNTNWRKIQNTLIVLALSGLAGLALKLL